MAWQGKKRKWPARWSGKRTAGAVQRKLDRKLNKRFQWVPLADNLCGQVLGPCKGCCEDQELELTARGCEFDDQGALVTSSPNPTAVVLIPPADVPTEFGPGAYSPDTLTVVRLVGRIELCPLFCDSAEKTTNCNSLPDNCQLFAEFQNQFRNFHLRGALDKSKWEWDPLQQAYIVPARFPLDTQEWTDAQFLRQWERYKGDAPGGTGISLNGDAPIGCCGDVSSAGAGAPANTLSNGSGTVNIPAISTDCEPCNGEAGTHRSSQTTSERLRCFSLSFNSRRRMVFKENEGLTFWFDWTSFTPAQAPTDGWRPNVAFAWRMWLKAQLEVA